MTKHVTAEKTGRHNAPIMAGRLCAPVVIVILAVLAALAVLLKQYG
jgi:hypothetical protein